MKMTGNTILITGGTSGIGLGLALRLHQAGNKVIVAGRRKELLDEITAEHPGIDALVLDVTDPDSIARIRETVAASYPELNILVNNAGIMLRENLLDPASLPVAEDHVTVNLLGTIRVTYAFLPLLVGKEDAAVVNVTSALAFVPLPITPTYNATKAALHSFSESLRVQLAQADARADRIRRDDDGFTVTDQHGQEHHARRLVVATGLTRPNTPDIPGIETAEDYSVVSVDPEEFTDRCVLIIGKGNSALETADNLVETAAVIHVAGPHSIRMAWNSHYVGHLRAVNNNFLDTYQLKSQNALLDGKVLSIEKDPDGMYRVHFSFSRADEVVKELRYERVIICTGFRFDASVFDPQCRPALVIDDRFAALSPAYESVNVPGLHFAGTLMQQRDFKKSTGGFIHGFRYAVRALGHILDERHHDRTWPHRPLDASPSALADAVVGRVNRSSALWQQFGVIGDLIVAPPGEPARYHEEVPVAYAHGRQLTENGDYFTVTLEYGPDHDKVDPAGTPGPGRPPRRTRVRSRYRH
jgi:short-subunit dehydrogenase involved in D-alanine esterification of teichoic acids